MSTLVVECHLSSENRLDVNPSLRSAAGPDQPWESARLDWSPICELSRQIYRVLVSAVGAVFSAQGELDLRAARGHLEEMRRLGTRLRDMLLLPRIVERLRGNASIQHILFQMNPELNLVPYEWMFLGGDDFLGFRYGTGRQLLTIERGVVAAAHPVVNDGPQGQRGYKTFSIVDPGRLLVSDNVRDLQACFQKFRDTWDGTVHAGGQRYRQLLDVDGARAFRSVSKQHVVDAVRYAQMVNFVGHYHDDTQHPELSGFVLDRSAEGENVVFTAEDLLECLNAGESPPYVLLSIACRSGVTEGWETAWDHNKELFGMVDAAIRTGIRHYIGTVSKIPAAKSPELMLPFYSRLMQGYTVGRALQEARRSLRKDANDPLDGGTLLGLAFVLYGDPAAGYFCAAGHRTDRAATLTCQATEADGSMCGRTVCNQDAGFAAGRCVIHGARPMTCSAGHVVSAASELAICRKCRNTVCSACPGSGQQLCWEHDCHNRHEVVGDAKKCRGQARWHPQERRGVCALDGGFLRGLCDECLANDAAQGQQQEVCPHCAMFVTPQNPWSGTCTDPACGKPLCAHCVTWHDQTMCCPSTQRTAAEREAGWLSGLEERGQQDEQLATLPRLTTYGDMAHDFQASLEINLTAHARGSVRMPYLRASKWSAVGMHPRIGRVRLNVVDLGSKLVEGWQQKWDLPLDRGGTRKPWQPPATWCDAFAAANTVRVHQVAGWWGAPVLVVVATLVPIEFARQRGPVVVPCGELHLKSAEDVIKSWWRETRRNKPLSDIYLVALSANGWEPTRAKRVDGPGRLTVIAWPKGEYWQVTLPAMDDQQRQFVDFVDKLSLPMTVCQMKQETRQWVESALEGEDFVTMVRVQDAMEAEWERVVDDQLVLDVFASLQRTGRYMCFMLADGQDSLRPATQQERAARTAGGG